MRLGDLDALKEKINAFYDKLFVGCVSSDLIAYASGVDGIIDNAPTVFSCNACKNMGNERECVDCHDYSNYAHYEERPQGEWIGNAFDEHHCNRCGHPALWEEEPDDYYEVQSNFCPHCGAKMKGGAE